MPRGLEKKVKRRGGVKRWRTIKRDGQLIKIAIVRKRGPRGGHTLGYEMNPG